MGKTYRKNQTDFPKKKPERHTRDTKDWDKKRDGEDKKRHHVSKNGLYFYN